jgi:hypothetical protein
VFKQLSKDKRDSNSPWRFYVNWSLFSEVGIL